MIFYSWTIPSLKNIGENVIMTKTYDGQTAHFIAAILDAMPRGITAEVMQFWIQRPKTLQDALSKTLSTNAKFDLDKLDELAARSDTRT